MTHEKYQTDCRTEEGITVALIDSLIAISRILVTREFDRPSIREALKDLASDEDLLVLISLGESYEKD